MRVIEKLPVTESPAVSVNISQLTVESLANVVSLAGPIEVFHVAFASETATKDKKAGFNPQNLGYFPSNFVTSESGILAVASSSKFTAKLGDLIEFYSTTKDGSTLAEAVVGCGKLSEFKCSDAYTLSKTLAKAACKHNCKNVVFVLDQLSVDLSEAIVVGFLNHISVDKRFKKDATTDYVLEGLHVVSSCLTDVAAFGERCKIYAKAMHVSRELTSAPSNYANTISISNYVNDKLSALGLTVEVLGEEECVARGMGSYLAVAQGSHYPPRFLHATYRGEGPVKAKIALVGKGIMFDSGGYNIKSASSEIHLMKFDMGGMSAVFGAAEAIATLKPKGVEVHFISATCENMVDSTSYRPGDVIAASNGKTIEIINTDAEGRLTLADALVYAEKLGVDYIVDLATLTGGCIVALGFHYGGYFTNDEELNKRFVRILEKSGELAWRLPLAKEYADCLESSVADINNCNYTVKCSTISAALFLKEFVDSAKWLHWDIAGTAFEKSDARGTGYGVRTLVNLVLDLAEEK